MFDLDRIKVICREYGIAPSKSRGQNFLIDETVVKKIIDLAKVESKETILEVGPGLGVLTDGLVKKAKKVLAVELDKKVIKFLANEFAGIKNLQIIEGDVLKINLSKFLTDNEEYRVIANLPYNITSHFLRIFLELKVARPKEMILMLQKEVAERIVARAGEMSKLSVMAQFYGEPKIILAVNRDSFWPKPAVDSAMIKITLKEKLPPVDLKGFFQLVNIGFSSRRKQLHNNLAGGLKIKSEAAKALLARAGFSEKIRAQELEVNDWLKLLASL